MLVIIHREDHDAAIGVMAEDFGGGFNAVETGQPDIHQHHIGPVFLDERHGVGARFGFSDHAKIIRAAKDRLICRRA